MSKISKKDLQMEKRIIKIIKTELIEDILADMCELRNNLADDLEMSKIQAKRDDKIGYATYKKFVKTIKKYTLKVLEKKIEKWEKRIL